MSAPAAAVTPLALPEEAPLRFVTAASLFDGHDASINIMRRMLQSSGAEVVHLGHDRGVDEIVDVAIQEDADAIAVSSYQGGHVEYFTYLVERLAARGAAHVRVFGGGGGVIVPSEVETLHARGVARIYTPRDGQTMGLQGMIDHMLETARAARREARGTASARPGGSDPLAALEALADAPFGEGKHGPLARLLSAIENGTLSADAGARLATLAARGRPAASGSTEADRADTEHDGAGANDALAASRPPAPVLGITGTGGSGKSSLTDELIRRLRLDQRDAVSVALIAIDPTRRKTGGALLGDRIRMNALGHERLFMRSVATRGAMGEVPPGLDAMIAACRLAGVDLVVVETPGIGQGDAGIADVGDVSLYVMTPEFGAASQLEKIDMLDFADVVAINKLERRGGEDALRDVRKQVQRNREAFERAPEDMPVYGTVAARFGDDGVTALYRALAARLAERGLALADGALAPVDVRASTRRETIVPTARERYLAEIAECVRGYHRESETQARHARERQQLLAARALLVGDVPRDGASPSDEGTPASGARGPQSGSAADADAVRSGITAASAVESSPSTSAAGADGDERAAVSAARVVGTSGASPAGAASGASGGAGGESGDESGGRSSGEASGEAGGQSGGSASGAPDATMVRLDTLVAERDAALSNASRRLLGEWPDIVARHAADELVEGEGEHGTRTPLATYTLSGTRVPRVALPRHADHGDLLAWRRRENLPGHFPYTAGVFPLKRADEDPTRMFAGEGDAARTNRRFHALSAHASAKRLSTAFDSVTLYGRDPAERPDIRGKVGNAGVSIATVEDMQRLYEGFDLCDPSTSVSMTINGPAPTILAFYLVTAIRQQIARFEREHGRAPGDEERAAIRAHTCRNLRGTVQADILKEDQGQNTCIFSTEFGLRMMADIQQWFIEHEVRRFYSVSISGYHIAEAGANPITQLALTLSNGFTYVESYLARGMAIDDFAPSLSFFFSNGMDAEYTVLGRVARRVWAIAMRERYGASERSCRLKYHVQTSGRSLHAQEMAFNDIRTTLQALIAVYDNCNSLHTNAYDEAVTTPTDESVRRAMAIQLVINREWGLAKNENPNQGSFVVEELTDLVEEAVLAEFERLSERGGVLGAMESGYQRGKIQDESMRYEHAKHDGSLPIVGVNTFVDADGGEPPATIALARSSEAEKRGQIERLAAFHARHADAAPTALERVKRAASEGGNVFDALVDAVEVCSLGQITDALFEVGGQYRRNL